MQTYSVWGLPKAEDGRRFQAVIDALCRQQNVPSFVPHLTLGGTHRSEIDLQPILAALSGLELVPTEIVETPEFTKSLSVRFALSERLLAGRQALESQPYFRSGRQFDPHVSLCYGPPKARAEIESAVEAILAAPVRFDRLVVMQITLPVERHSDLETWNEVSVHPIPA